MKNEWRKWYSILLGPYRGVMRECYHQSCDSSTDNQLSKFANVTFLTKTCQALIYSVIDLSESQCMAQRDNFYMMDTYRNHIPPLSWSALTISLSPLLIIFRSVWTAWKVDSYVFLACQRETISIVRCVQFYVEHKTLHQRLYVNGHAIVSVHFYFSVRTKRWQCRPFSYLGRFIFTNLSQFSVLADVHFPYC